MDGMREEIAGEVLGSRIEDPSVKQATGIVEPPPASLSGER